MAIGNSFIPIVGWKISWGSSLLNKTLHLVMMDLLQMIVSLLSPISGPFVGRFTSSHNVCAGTVPDNNEAVRLIVDKLLLTNLTFFGGPHDWASNKKTFSQYDSLATSTDPIMKEFHQTLCARIAQDGDYRVILLGKQQTKNAGIGIRRGKFLTMYLFYTVPDIIASKVNCVGMPFSAR